MYERLQKVSSLSSSIDNKKSSVEMIMCSGQPNDAGNNPCLETSEEHLLLPRKSLEEAVCAWFEVQLDEENYLGFVSNGHLKMDLGKNVIKRKN